MMADRTHPGTVQRRLSAILSADVVGYSRLMAGDEVATLKTLKAYRDAMGGLIRQHGGRVVDAVGDNLLAEFPSVVDGFGSAVAIQGELEKRNADLPAGRKMHFRIGIHLGDVLAEDERIYGEGVNIAARLESLADPGGICISGTVYEQVRRRLSAAYEDMGEQTLKNIADPVRVYRVRLGDAGQWDDGAEFTAPGFAGCPAIAVLPFDNLSGDPEQEYFADGIVEDLITRLSALRLFPVIARNSTFVYKGKPVQVKNVSRELGVRYVVEGSVRKAANRVRISVQLIDATTSHHIWAERYDRELSDIFALQDEIIDTIVGSLGPTLGRAERERAIRKTSQDLDAWDCVQRGMWHVFRGTKEDALEANSLFHKATELDPQFPLAFGGLAMSHLHQLSYQWCESPAQCLADALTAAEKSVALGEDEPQSYAALGLVCLNTGQYERALAALERAIELNPSSASGYWGLGMTLSWLGHPDEGVELIKKAIRLSPHDPMMYEFLVNLGMAHFLAERYEEAIVWAKKSLQLRLHQPGAYRLLAASYGFLGRAREARAALNTMYELSPDFSLEALRLRVAPVVIERYLEGWRKSGWEG